MPGTQGKLAVGLRGGIGHPSGCKLNMRTTQMGLIAGYSPLLYSVSSRCCKNKKSFNVLRFQS